MFGSLPFSLTPPNPLKPDQFHCLPAPRCVRQPDKKMGVSLGKKGPAESERLYSPFVRLYWLCVQCSEFRFTDCLGGEVQEVRLHHHLSCRRSAKRACRSGQIGTSPTASGYGQLFLLLDCVSLQSCGGVQRTAVAQQCVFAAPECRGAQQHPRGEEVECCRPYRCLAHRGGAAE